MNSERNKFCSEKSDLKKARMICILEIIFIPLFFLICFLGLPLVVIKNSFININKKIKEKIFIVNRKI